MKIAIRFAFLALLASLPVHAHAYGNLATQAGDGAADSAPGTPLSGKVVETMASGGYTYILIEKEGKKTWAAIPETEVTVGSELTLRPGMEMRNFASKGLKRNFESIFFSAGLAAQPESTKGKSSKGSQSGVVAPAEKVSVDKATGPNAYTVAELHQQKGKLEGKKVAVRGKVTKVAAGIMGKNWVHLQDGSGDAKKGSHDLTVTSQDLPAVGDVVTASGILRRNKDFGGGYKYELIMEEGSLKH